MCVVGCDEIELFLNFFDVRAVATISDVFNTVPNFTDSLCRKIEVGGVIRLEKLPDTSVRLRAFSRLADDVCVHQKQSTSYLLRKLQSASSPTFDKTAATAFPVASA